MAWFVRAFLKASLVWLVLGVSAGTAMAVHPIWTIYRPAHVHMVLLGFVTMMIYGVAYHVLPRFAAVPLRGARAAGWHWWASNLGLVLMVAGFGVRAGGVAFGTVLLGCGGALSAGGAYVFAVLMWRTLCGAAAPHGLARAASAAPAPAAAPRTPMVAQSMHR